MSSRRTRASRARAPRAAPLAAPPARPNLLLGETLPPSPRQQRSIARQHALKAAALQSFGEKGYERTSIDDIATRAEVPIGCFYQHFRSKRQLLLVLMNDLVQILSEFEVSVDSTIEPRAAIRTLVSRVFAAELHYLGAYRAWQEAALLDAGLARKNQKLHAWTTSRITNLFAKLLAVPRARARVDVTGLAEVMDAYFWTLLTQALRMPAASIERWIDSSTHLVYHALFLDNRNQE